ncbi:recombination protein RecR [Acidihalobacter yilgarnensis]|uniref:Recombination protein RecR n=1 Tax=Acidihalobacter yilgarnensis TaxID=2819280 RepID=A0A1D8IM67_9GAMM|nr:recombination mediator RecR [Acidihalobacter yilgarnensis]AOU97559.1 recombination protein RecR [Acidihalobacter yilgarnensis]
MAQSALLDALVEALRCLPGVGPKSAQRMAYYLLERHRDDALRLSDTLKVAVERIGHCERCRTLSETGLCSVCDDTRRDAGLLCVVESPSHLQVMEQATHFKGVYHVLMGRLSPLDGIGPEELGLDLLEQRLAQGEVRELIMAISPTVEGEVTAHYLGEMAHAHGVRVTRLAQGVPMGGELEYLDSGTLTHAFESRREY